MILHFPQANPLFTVSFFRLAFSEAKKKDAVSIGTKSSVGFSPKVFCGV